MPNRVSSTFFHSKSGIEPAQNIQFKMSSLDMHKKLFWTIFRRTVGRGFVVELRFSELFPWVLGEFLNSWTRLPNLRQKSLKVDKFFSNIYEEIAGILSLLILSCSFFTPSFWVKVQKTAWCNCTGKMCKWATEHSFCKSGNIPKKKRKSGWKKIWCVTSAPTDQRICQI